MSGYFNAQLKVGGSLPKIKTTKQKIKSRKNIPKEEPIMPGKSKPVKILIDADTSRFSKRIGSIIYKVSINFNQDAQDTLDGKVVRLIKNEMEVVSRA